ncbi:glycosyltransferase [Bacillus sp. JJ1562]|uniref:glycosyltransferase n=1 Tax=Bacillus sp. JJ1562 TaxID=3122960 RepID=UPI0030010BAD
MKGYDRKISLFEKLKEHTNEFQWIIVGSGDYLSELKNKVSESIISDNVTFVGRIDRGKLRQFYSSVDIFILLSNYRESFGLVYLEANACGCPVIGREYGGVSEVINNNISGLLVKDSSKYDLSLQIYKSITSRCFKKDKIIEHANKFKLENTAKEFIKIL